MNERKIHYIDVSKMPEHEICQVLNIKYVPWYRSSMFWSLALCFTLPSFILILEILK